MTIYFYIFIFMLNFFLLFVDCILQTIGNDIKSSSYIMYFIKILYHETKVFIINCDEDVMKVFDEVLYQNCCDEDSMKFYHVISRWRFDEDLSLNCCDEVLYQNCCDEDSMKFCRLISRWSIRWSVMKYSMKYSMKMWWSIRWRCDEVLSLNITMKYSMKMWWSSVT